MSANVDTMMYVGVVPWHGLGVKLDNPATSEEAIIAAQLDWNVEVAKLGYNHDNKWKVVPEMFATVRTDKNIPLGVVGRLYTPVQNTEAFSFFDSVVGEKAAMYEVAGSLGKGETVWLLAKLPGEIRIGKTDDIINKYLLLVNRHDATAALRMFFTPIRVVCQNTLSAAMNVRKAGEGVVIRHFPDIHKKVEQAREILKLSVDTYAKLGERFNYLATIPVNDVWVDKYLTLVLPSDSKGVASQRLENMRETIAQGFHSISNSLPGIKGTAWAAYNAVTEYVDHGRVVPKLARDSTRRLESIWLGSGAVMKERALRVALEKAAA